MFFALSKSGSRFDREISPELASTISYHNENGGNKSKELEESRNTGNASNSIGQSPRSEPSVAHVMISVSSDFFLCLFRLLNFDNNRRFVGVSLFSPGLLLAGWGLW